MADNDIYNSKLKYDNFKKNIKEFLLEPSKRINARGNPKYYCKNPLNIKYFEFLFNKLEAKDLSYVRRNRLIADMRLISYLTGKDFKDLEREDMDGFMKFVSNNSSQRTRADFATDIKFLWKILFPEKDERDRIDETIIPYAVRHLSSKIDKSREKSRNDRISWEEFENLVNYFNNDPKMQCYLALALESLGRPQEILYTKIKNVELHDNYAKVLITEHGKEGTKFLICIDSYPYLAKWLDNHKFKKDEDCYLFVKYDYREPKGQLTPKNINARLRTALKELGINKDITCYSIKRNGVTFRRLRGESDVEIQHIAGWTSTKMMRHYDMSEQEDTLKLQLIKRGLIKDKENKYPNVGMQLKTCIFCGHGNKFTDEICSNCKRLLDRDKIRKYEEEQQGALRKLKEAMQILAQNISNEKKEELNRILS